MLALNRMLMPLARYYERPDTEEIAIVSPGGLFRRQRDISSGVPWVFEPDDTITLDYATAVITAVGNVMKGPRKAVVYGELEGESGREHRFVGAMGPNIAHGARRQVSQGVGVAMCIRQGPDKNRETQLSQWDVQPGDTERHNPMAAFGRPPDDEYSAIFGAAHSGSPMLFSGPPGSGKTTLLNMLLRELDINLRVITVEDTAELQVPNPNHTHIFMKRSDDEKRERSDPEGRNWDLGPADVINLVTRMTPDVIIVGEVSADNGALTMELSHTGHRNFWASIHAHTAEEAATAFIERIKHSNKNIDEQRELANVLNSFVIIQCNRTAGGQRVITEIHQPEARA